MKNIIIPDQNKFDSKLKAIVAAGKDKLHVRMDFDGTVTEAIVGGKTVPSLTSILRDEDILGKDYSLKARALYDKYHAIEIDPEIAKADKKNAMHEWWSTHFELMIKSGLGKKHIEQVLLSSRIRLRKGFKEFAQTLAANNIPLVIMSSDGLGAATILLVLENNKIPPVNIHIVSNQFEWDSRGRVIKVKEPIIHTLNKNEETIRRVPAAYETIKDRPNVLLLGDSVADITMVEGARILNLLSLGFLNKDSEKQRAAFRQTFDAIILNDGPMDFANLILAQIVNI